MREILVYDDYEIHKLGAGGGTQYEEVTTEKATRIDVTDVAKTKGKLLPFGRTTQKQLSGKNILNIADGNTLTTKSFDITDYIKVDKTYSFSAYLDLKNTTSTAKARIRIDKYAGTEITYSSGNLIANKENGVSKIENVTFDSSVTQVLLTIQSYGVADFNCDYSQVMGEISSTATDYEEYCGGQPSPNPDYPQPIENVEGRSCSNLVGGKWFNGLYNADGSISNVNRNYRSFKINLKAGTYIYSYENNVQLNAVRSVNITANSNITISNKTFTLENDSEISLGFKKTDNSDWDLGENLGDIQFHLNEGSTALPYEPYFEGKRLEINVFNKNLFDKNKVTEGYRLVWTTGLPYADDSAIMTDYIYVELNKSYVWSSQVIVAGYNKEKEYIGCLDSTGFQKKQGNKYTGITISDSSVKYIRLFSYSILGELNKETFQVEEGTTVTSYEEHKEQMIPFPLAEGQKLMEGDYLADDGVHHMRGQHVLKGNESFSGSANYNGSYYLAWANIGNAKRYAPFLCNRATYVSSTTNYKIGCCLSDNAMNLWLGDSSQFSNVVIFKQYLAEQYANGAPIIIEYELEQEIVDPYTPAQLESYNKLMNLKLYKGVNHIWTETDGLEPNLQLTYKRKKQSNVLQVSNIQQLNNLELNNTEETPEEITTEISEE